MDERLRRRIAMFYLAGIVNAFLGLYVFIEGATFLPQGTVTWLVIFFLAFAAVDFYFPYAMKKKWQDEQARRGAAGGGAAGTSGGPK